MKKCDNCKYSEDHGESVKWIKCKRKKKSRYVEKDYLCKHFVKNEENINNKAV